MSKLLGFLSASVDSRLIAKELGVGHDDVAKAIDKLVNAGIIDMPPVTIRANNDETLLRASEFRGLHGKLDLACVIEYIRPGYISGLLK